MTIQEIQNLKDWLQGTTNLSADARAVVVTSPVETVDGEFVEIRLRKGVVLDAGGFLDTDKVEYFLLQIPITA